MSEHNLGEFEQIVLLAENRCDRATAVSRKLQVSRNAQHTFQLRLVLVEGADTFVGVQVVEQQLGLMGECFDRKGATMHGRLMIAAGFGHRQ